MLTLFQEIVYLKTIADSKNEINAEKILNEFTFSLLFSSLVFFLLLIADIFHFSLSEESEEYFAEQEEPEEVQRAHD